MLDAPVDRRRWLRSAASAVLALPLARLWPAGCAAAAEASEAGGLPDPAEVERVLWKRVLDAWYPRCLEREGGFHENFAEDWTPLADGSKFLVHQARQTWTPAAVALRYPGRRERFLGYAGHGLRFLGGRMWDRQHGGFFDHVDAEGRPHPDFVPWKNLYAQAFGIYERAAHDPAGGGYFEQVTLEGTPVRSVPAGQPAWQPGVIGNVGQKSMNAHIHLLEALTALRKVWDDELLARRLREVFHIVRDRIVAGRGHLVMFAAPDWKPLDERNSFGHQLETAFLLVEAQESLGIDDPTEREKTRQTALNLVDQSLRYGWDAEHGGFYDEGPPEGLAEKRHKVWWVEVEALNGLLTADELSGADGARYRDPLVRTWAFFRDRMIDPRHGGCYEVTDEAGEPPADNRKKASPWKTSYHVVRALLETLRRVGG